MDEKRPRIGQDRLRTRTRNVEEERAPFHYRTQVLPAFYLTVPADELIGQPAPPLTFCLAERGQQYLVYSDAGVPFYLDTFDPVGEPATLFGSISYEDSPFAKTGSGQAYGKLKNGGWFP
jgi:hypothetical protein